MFVKKSTAQKFTIPGGTSGLLYPASPRGDQTVAAVEMDGVYPERGFSLNDTCTETIYLVSGRLEAEVDGKKFFLEPGDVLTILPGSRYRITGCGTSVDLITPAWDKAQNHIVS